VGKKNVLWRVDYDICVEWIWHNPRRKSVLFWRSE